VAPRARLELLGFVQDLSTEASQNAGNQKRERERKECSQPIKALPAIGSLFQLSMYGRCWDPYPLIVLVEFPEPDFQFFFVLQLIECRALFQVLAVKTCPPLLVIFRYWFLSKAFEGRYL